MNKCTVYLKGNVSVSYRAECSTDMHAIKFLEKLVALLVILS